MKASQFKKLIKEAVKEAVKEALRELETPREPVVEQKIKQEPVTYVNNIEHSIIEDPIQAMINETKANMRPDEYKNVLNMNSSAAPNFRMQADTSQAAFMQSSEPEVGVDISQFDFVQKASTVLKAAEQKDKQKYGIPTA